MAAESIIEIIMRARDEASKVMQQAGNNAQKSEKQVNNAGRSMQGALAAGANIARAALFGLGGAALLVGAQLIALEREVQQAAAELGGISGATKDSLPEIAGQLKDLAAATGASMSDVSAALKSVATDFLIFNPKNKEGIATYLIDWKAATGQAIEEAGKNFRRLILVYFKDRDTLEALRESGDKIYAVARAIGVDPGGLAAAMAEAAPLLKTAFQDFDDGLSFLGQIAYYAGDAEVAKDALITFSQAVGDIRNAFKKGEDPDEGLLDMFGILGINRETVQNDAILTGELMMLSLKNAMADNKITAEEQQALGVLFGEEVGPIMQAAAGYTGDAIQRIKQALQGYEGSVKSAADVTRASVEGDITKSWNKFLADISKSNQWEGVKKAATGIMDALVGFTQTDWSKVGKGLLDMKNGLVSTLIGADRDEVNEAIIWWWNDVATPAIKGFFSKYSLTALLDKNEKMVKGLWEKLLPSLNEAGTFLQGWGDTVATTLSNLWVDGKIFSGKLKAASVDFLLTKLLPTVEGANEFLTSWARDVGTSLANLWTDGKVLAGKVGQAGSDLLMRKLFPALESVKEFVTSWSTDTVTTLSNLWIDGKIFGSKIKDAGAAWWELTKASWSEAITGTKGIVPWATNRWSDLQAGFDLWVTRMKTVGSDLLGGLMMGLSAKYEDTRKKVVGIGGDVLTWFKDTFKMKSPSRATAEMGGWLMEGLTRGIESEKDSTLSSVMKAGMDVLTAFRSTQHDGNKSRWGAIMTLGMVAVKAAVGEGAGPILKQVQDFAEAALAAFTSTEGGWTKFGSFLKGKFTEWSQGMTGWAAVGMQVAGQFAEFLGGQAQEGFSNFGGAFKEFLLQMLTGLEAQIIAQQVAGIAVAIMQAPATFGASLLAIPGMVAAAGAAFLAFEGAKMLVNSFDVGTTYVKGDQLAQIHDGEMIIPKNFAQGLRDGEVSLGGGGESVIVQVILDGRTIAQQVGQRIYQGTRELVRADLPALR